MKTHDPMTNKTKGLIPLPSGSIPEGVRCVSICIPDSNEYYRILFGAIYELTHWNNYERDDTHKATLVAKAWRSALMEGILRCNQLRNAGGKLEISTDGGATWTPVQSLPPEQGTYDPKTTGTMQPARTGTNKPCLAARNAAACIEVLHAYMVQWYDDWGTVLTITLFLQAILVAFLPLDWPIALAIISFDYLAQSMIALSDALTTGSWTETVTQDLTCILFCRADNNGQWSQAGFDAVRSDCQAKNTHIFSLIDLWLDQVIGLVGLNNAGTTTSIASYDCDSCSCTWCYEFDFTVGQQGWTAWHVGYNGSECDTVWDSGQGWGNATCGLPQPSTWFGGKFNFLTPVSVHKVTVGWRGVVRTSSGNGSVFTLGVGRPADGNSDVDYVADQTLTGLMAVGAVVQDWGHGHVAYVKLYGTGDNPFGVSNCY